MYFFALRVSFIVSLVFAMNACLTTRPTGPQSGRITSTKDVSAGRDILFVDEAFATQANHAAGSGGAINAAQACGAGVLPRFQDGWTGRGSGAGPRKKEDPGGSNRRFGRWDEGGGAPNHLRRRDQPAGVGRRRQLDRRRANRDARFGPAVPEYADL